MMNDTEILDKVIRALKSHGKDGLDSEQVCQLGSWAKAQRKQEAEVQESMSASTETAERIIRKSLEQREKSAEEMVREIVREELSIAEREGLVNAGASIYASTLMAPLAPRKWAHCKTYSYDMIDHSPEYEPEFYCNHWGEAVVGTEGG